MARPSRLLIEDRPTVYHVMSRTCLPGFPFGNAEKEFLMNEIKRFSRRYFTEIFGFCVMGNHFHLLVRMLPEEMVQSEDVLARYRLLFGENTNPAQSHLDYHRRKWCNLSEFVREIKQSFARYFNKRHNRRGVFWDGRFKSVIVEDGRTLVNCLAYIDLNPIRAGIVERPEDYRWSSIGYHAQSKNKDGFLSLDFGLVDWDFDNEKERFRAYREYLYETGALDTGKGRIDERVVQREREKDFTYTRRDRFIMRTRYFTASAIIGSSDFVSSSGRKLGLLNAENRKPKPVSGLEGIFSYRRLLEVL